MASSSSSAISGPIPPPRSLPVSEPTPASKDLALKYRGSTVEDLQLSPAVSVPTTATIGAALQVAFDHDYEQLPVLSNSPSGSRRLLGYLDVKRIKADVEAGKIDKGKGVKEHMVKFGASKGKDNSTYTLISPETGLGELEAFLSTYPFALVTDASRSFVLAVATREDLTKYAQRRGLEDSSAVGATTPTDRNKDTEMQDGTTLGAVAEQAPLSRREEEEKRKDRTLAEFLSMLDGYKPLIPDEVTDHYLEKVGFECEDVRLKRLLSLAAEKFVADIAADAFQYARIRTTGATKPKGATSGTSAAAAAAAAATAAASANSSGKDRSRTVLTMDDLSAALGEYGINSYRPTHYR